MIKKNKKHYKKIFFYNISFYNKKDWNYMLYKILIKHSQIYRYDSSYTAKDLLIIKRINNNEYDNYGRYKK